MSKYIDFYPDAIPAPVEQTKHIGTRIKAPFAALACDAATASKVRQANTTRKFDKTAGALVTNTDGEGVVLGLILTCVTTPNFNDSALQAAWGVLGAESLIHKMLLPGEYDELGKWISELTGYSATEEEEAVEEAKN